MIVTFKDMYISIQNGDIYKQGREYENTNDVQLMNGNGFQHHRVLTIMYYNRYYYLLRRLN